MDPTGQSIFGDVLTGLGIAAAVAAVPLSGGTSLLVAGASIGLDLVGSAANGASGAQLVNEGIVDAFSVGIGGLGDALAPGATSIYVIKGAYAAGAIATNALP